MAKSIRVGAMWVNEEKGTKNGNLDRKILEELLDKYAGNLRFTMFENERKTKDIHPDYYLVFFYPDGDGGSEKKETKKTNKGFGGKSGGSKGRRKSMF